MVEVTHTYVQKYMTTDQLGQDVMHVSGIVHLELVDDRSNSEWYPMCAYIPLDTEKWDYSEVKVPHIGLASIILSKDHTGGNVMWAANYVYPYNIDGIPYLKAHLSVDDRHAIIAKVSFTAIVVGVKDKEPVLTILERAHPTLLEEAATRNKLKGPPVVITPWDDKKYP